MASIYPIYRVSSTNTQEVVVNVVFGIFAVVASAIALWQGHRLWRTMRHGTDHPQGGPGPDNGIITLRPLMPFPIG